MTIYHCHLAVRVWCVTGCWCNVFAYKMWNLHWVLLIFIFPEENLYRYVAPVFTYQMPFLSPNQQCRTERSSKVLLVAWHCPFFLCHWTAEGRSIAHTRLGLALMYCGALWTRHNKCRHICRIGCRAVVPRLGLGSCRIGPAPFPGLLYEATKPGFSCWWCSIFVLRMNVCFCCVRFSPEIVWEAEMTCFVSSWT